jgi:hypothetical protein
MISQSHCSGSSSCTGPSESEDTIRDSEVGREKAPKRTEEIVEEFAAVFIGVESIVDVGLESRVDVSVVEFAIEDEEDGV